MGKITGFMEYSRQASSSADPLTRIQNFNEFHSPVSAETRQEQAARCMDCGVPFCQSCLHLNGAYSGCPLHNLIPEWNDLLYTGAWEAALSRLLKTASFPEFTGRVCPALCEAACTCGGLMDDAVTIRENELALIEYGFAHQLIAPRPRVSRSDKKIAVIGSGPAGLAAADLLNRRGHQVTVYEKADRPGGLLMYGIPNMKLDKHVIERRVNLMKAEGVQFLLGVEVGTDVTPASLTAEYDAVLLCCGAQNPRDLSVKGRETAKGVYFAVDFLSQTTKSLLDSDLKDGQYISAQDKHVIIVGGGDTGNDCCATAIRHGCRSLVQLEMMPQPPLQRSDTNPWPEWPRIAKTDYGQQEAIAVFGHDPRLYETTVKELLSDADGQLKEAVIVSLAFKPDPATGRMIPYEVPGSEKTLPCELLLIACGFTGPAPALINAFELQTAPSSAVQTIDGGYATNVPKVFAAGDMRRGQSLVVWAIAEGRAAAAAIDEYLMGYTCLAK
ncbi:MAG: glutamate synthase subunit beta [Lachnospiraceae bacterium]|jgi:glutamate synthase (NADPH/NADH) small chain|nr:glutamate synthase subunit beta [Lachnospiraceae bacterium]